MCEKCCMKKCLIIYPDSLSCNGRDTNWNTLFCIALQVLPAKERLNNSSINSIVHSLFVSALFSRLYSVVRVCSSEQIPVCPSENKCQDRKWLSFQKTAYDSVCCLCFCQTLIRNCTRYNYCSGIFFPIYTPNVVPYVDSRVTPLLAA